MRALCVMGVRKPTSQPRPALSTMNCLVRKRMLLAPWQARANKGIGLRGRAAGLLSAAALPLA